MTLRLLLSGIAAAHIKGQGARVWKFLLPLVLCRGIRQCTQQVNSGMMFRDITDELWPGRLDIAAIELDRRTTLALAIVGPGDERRHCGNHDTDTNQFVKMGKDHRHNA